MARVSPTEKVCITKWLIIVSLVVVAGLIIWQVVGSSRAQPLLTLELFSVGGEIRINKLTIARTPEETARGYMHRRNRLAKDEGMLFDYGRPIKGDEKTFWMRNTWMPLGVLFTDEKLRIVDILPEMIPFDETPRHASLRTTWRYAIEVAHETAQRAKLGMRVVIPPDLL
jgi:uncharacterized membrane protein (UPF0127 family)